jgi:coenzyme F420 biosynthesis associated uncharacterized protein
MAGTYPLAETYHGKELAATMPGITIRAAELVHVETGLDGTGAPDVLVTSRAEWAERNLSSFAHLLAPLEARIEERLKQEDRNNSASAELARKVVAVEAGALLGALSRRVLGQYELVLPTGDSGDAVAFVGANILALERRHQFRPSDFRMWIALHESTHRAQFAGVPWLRSYFLSLVEELVASAKPDPGKLMRVVDEVASARRERRPIFDENGVIGLFAGAEQKAVLDRVQALMSLLEGHGHVVMDRIGARLYKSQARMSAVLSARRRDPKTAALLRIAGLEMKMRQYEQGARFVKGVEQAAGWDQLALAWKDPQSLPDLAEIEQPEKWLERVGSAA